MITKPAPKPGEQKKRKAEINRSDHETLALLSERRKILRQLADVNRRIEERVDDFDASEVYAE